MSLAFNPYGFKFYKSAPSSAYESNMMSKPIVSGTSPVIGGIATNLMEGDPVCFSYTDDTVPAPALAGNTTIGIYPADGKFRNPVNAGVDFARAALGIFAGVEYTNIDMQTIKSTFWSAGTQTFNTAKGTVNGSVKIIPTTGNLFKIQATNGLGALANGITPGQPFTFTRLQDAMNAFLYKKFSLIVPKGMTTQVPASVFALDGSAGVVEDSPNITVVRVVDVVTNPRSTIDTGWMDPYPDLIVEFVKTYI